METCKDCVYLNSINECKNKNICVNYHLKELKDMKKIKVDQKTIKKYYKKACEDVKAELRQDFPEVFKSKLPKTWEEYVENTKDKFIEITQLFKHETGHHQGIIIDSKVRILKSNSKYTALRKLELLRDHYNDGWKPDNESEQSIILRDRETFIVSHNDTYISFLSFKNRKLGDKFYKNFKELIESAEDLI